MNQPGEPEVGDRLRATGERIDALLDASATAGAVARERAEELVRLTADLYGAGLERILDLVHEAGHLTDDVLNSLADDDLVASLLLVHGLHPYDVATRVEHALEGVRPYLGSHGGNVELLGVDRSGVVRLRLLGSCDGCPSSSVTLQLAVEGAIEAAAPEVTAIEVEEAGPDLPAAAGGVIPAASLWSRVESRAEASGSSWTPVPQLTDLAPGAVVSVEINGRGVLVCRIGADLFAFEDRCGRCESSLQSAVLARRLGATVGEAVLRCPRCAAHYDVRRAGACLDDEELHLAPLPLLTDGGITSVAVPTPVSV